MLATHVKRGMKAGAVAGLVFGLFVAIVANPFVAFADDLGTGGEHAGDYHDETEAAHQDAAPATAASAVSVAAGVLWGVLLGAVVFGVAFSFLEPLVPGTGGTKSYLLAAAGFVTVSGAPWLVLPPQPPGVEQALPTETRLLVYGGMMVAGATVCLLAGLLYDRLRPTRGRVTASAVAVLPFGLLAIPVVLSPANPVESTLPAELATGLVGMMVFGQALLWLLLAGAHARLHRGATRVADSRVAPGRREPTATAD